MSTHEHGSVRGEHRRTLIRGERERRQSAQERRGANGSSGKPGDALWDVETAAGYLSVSRSMVYKLEQAGELPCVRIGACIRFEPAVVRSFAKGERSTVPIATPCGPATRR